VGMCLSRLALDYTTVAMDSSNIPYSYSVENVVDVQENGMAGLHVGSCDQHGQSDFE